MPSISALLTLACALVAVVAAPTPAAEEAAAGTKLVKRLRAYPKIVYPGDPDFDNTYREPHTSSSDSAHDDGAHGIYILFDGFKE